MNQNYSLQQRLDNHEDPFKSKWPEGWDHCFVVKTKERNYQLFSNDYNLKELFVYCLKEMLKHKKLFVERGIGSTEA